MCAAGRKGWPQPPFHTCWRGLAAFSDPMWSGRRAGQGLGWSLSHPYFRTGGNPDSEAIKVEGVATIPATGPCGGCLVDLAWVKTEPEVGHLRQPNLCHPGPYSCPSNQTPSASSGTLPCKDTLVVFLLCAVVSAFYCCLSGIIGPGAETCSPPQGPGVTVHTQEHFPWQQTCLEASQGWSRATRQRTLSWSNHLFSS